MGMFSELKALFELINIVDESEQITKQEKFRNHITPIYQQTKFIVEDIISFFEEELEKLEFGECTGKEVIFDVRKFRNKNRSTRIEIRETVKNTNYFMDNKELKIFAIGVMAILNGGLAIRLYGHRLDRKFVIDLHEVLTELVNDDTRLEELYFIKGHVIMDTINYQEYKKYEALTQTIKHSIALEKDKETKLKLQKILDRRNFDKYLYMRIKNQINEIYSAWAIVVASYTILKNEYH